ncbi:hypothetical protein G6F63_015786 [Rhizopus arrhizus]|nr:hypothetical protein G6F63_015786 [Rhizopus arrhizus]
MFASIDRARHRAQLLRNRWQAMVAAPAEGRRGADRARHRHRRYHDARRAADRPAAGRPGDRELQPGRCQAVGRRGGRWHHHQRPW